MHLKVKYEELKIKEISIWIILIQINNRERTYLKNKSWNR